MIRRESRLTSSSTTGFTIVELLIVIIVIAILAAITIVTYTGITKQATESSMQSDARNAAQSIEIEKATSGNYPDSAAGTNDGSGLKASGQNQLAYFGGSGQYCIKVTNPNTSTVYHVSSTSPTVSLGSCGVWVTTLAGGQGGCTNGSGIAAKFGWDYGIAVGKDGTVYVASTGCFQIRKISPSGAVTTLAGSTQGYSEGVGAAAQFNYPYRVAASASGNVYVSDSNDNRVRKITPDGNAITLAGSGVAGDTNGTGAAAQFRGPSGIAVDAAENVYVIDGVGRIRKITPGGTVTTFAGANSTGYVDDKGAAARFKNPQGLAVDTAGNLFVADSGNSRIRKITPDGTVTTYAGSGASGGYVDGAATTTAQFSGPQGLAVDKWGNVYVADGNNNCIRKITPDGQVSTVAGNADDWELVNGPGGVGRFNYPVDVAVDSVGTLYVMDNGNFAIRRIDQ